MKYCKDENCGMAVRNHEDFCELHTGPQQDPEATALDVQVGGNHYKQFKIQPVEFCQKNKLPTCESNIIKYVCRHGFKNGLEDLKKAKHYLEILIDLEYGE